MLWHFTLTTFQVVRVVSDKESCIQNIYRTLTALLQPNQKTNDPILKRAKDLNRHASQEDIQVLRGM